MLGFCLRLKGGLWLADKFHRSQNDTTEGFMIKQFIALISLLFSFQLASASDAFDIRQILNNGGSVEVGSEFDSFDIRSFISIGHERVTVRSAGFDTFDTRQFATLGARLIVGKPFDSFDIRSIISAAKAGSYVSVRSAGFDSFDLRQFASLGAQIIN